MSDDWWSVDADLVTRPARRYRNWRDWHWGRIGMWAWLVTFVVMLAAAAARW